MEHFFKIVLIGSSEVSKKFVTIYTESKFQEDYFDALGIAVDTKKITIDNYIVKLFLVRISSQRKFYRISRARVKEFIKARSSACIIFFEKKDRSSYQDIPKWYEEFRKHAHSTQFPIAVVGITSDSEEISTEEAQALTEQFLNCAYFECTLKNRNELEAVVKHLVRERLKLDRKSM